MQYVGLTLNAPNCRFAHRRHFEVSPLRSNFRQGLFALLCCFANWAFWCPSLQILAEKRLGVHRLKVKFSEEVTLKQIHAAWQKEENVKLYNNCNWHGRHTRKYSALQIDHTAKWVLSWCHTGSCDLERAKIYKYVQIVPKIIKGK